MITVGITGQAGFVGTHLFNYLKLDPERFTMLPFKDEYFKDPEILENWVAQCDAVVHLAALNRHNDAEVLYRTNLELVDQLISAMERTGVSPHILFSSSTQEVNTNPYGRSKKEGREKLQKWTEHNGSLFTGLVIPNVFGPFGNPYYNSVVATFSYQLNHGELPRIEVDKEMRLIYVGKLVEHIRDCILNRSEASEMLVPHSAELNVSELLELLQEYHNSYGEHGRLPALKNEFERDLFNTFRSYMDIAGHFPVVLKLHSDERGSFVETIHLEQGGQVSFSTTRPGITRGNHYHTRKIERFAVIHGKALIQMRRIGTDKVLEFQLDGKNPAYVDMPVWYTHNISNVGDEDLFTIFWINEFYNPEDPDTYFETV